MTENERKHRNGWTLIICAIMAASVLTVYLHPEWLHVGHQPPVAASVRDSFIGFGRVLQLFNQGTEPLVDVWVTANDTARNGRAQYHIDRIEPGHGVELGWKEWNWSVDPGETYPITAAGYLPIVFSSSQLGVN